MKKGFIQIPVLIAIVVGVFAFGGVSYVGVKQYQQYQQEKLGKEILLRQREEELQESLALQQKALENATSEIEKLKQESETVKIKPKEYTISAENLAPYLTGVMQIKCGNIFGSVSLWNFYDGIMPTYAVLTNKHVAEGMIHNCLLFPGTDSFSDTNSSQEKIMASVDPQQTYQWNDFTDIAVTSINKPFTVKDNCEGRCAESVSKEKLNYNISAQKKCSEKMPVGSPVVIIGFPAFGMTSDSASHRISSNGIISGYNNRNNLDGYIPYDNYFVSAKIDSGNSGGIAFSKDENGLCVLGVPTWLNIGNYETQGLIQNIHNVMYQQ